jgi:hypothetical protein
MGSRPLDLMTLKVQSWGIVSKRLGSLYRSGRADCSIKVRNPNEAEENWSP